MPTFDLHTPRNKTPPLTAAPPMHACTHMQKKQCFTLSPKLQEPQTLTANSTHPRDLPSPLLQVQIPVSGCQRHLLRILMFSFDIWILYPSEIKFNGVRQEFIFIQKVKFSGKAGLASSATQHDIFAHNFHVIPEKLQQDIKLLKQ